MRLRIGSPTARGFPARCADSAMARIATAVALAVAMALAGTPAFAEEASGRQRDATTLESLTVICDDNYAPYSFRGPAGQIQGILVDRWKAWEKKSGVPVEFRAMPWAEAQKVFLSGDGDVLDTVFVTEERKRVYAFSAPYLSIKVPVYIHRTISGIARVSDLRGFRVALKEGDAVEEQLSAGGVSDLVFYSSYEAIVLAAKDGEVKIFCIDQPPAQYNMYKHGIDRDFKIAFMFPSGDFHRVVRKGDEWILSEVERIHRTIPAATIKAIDRRWLGFDLGRVLDFRVIAWVAAAAVIGASVVLGWIAALRRRVRSATAELRDKVSQLESSEAKNAAFISLLPDLIFTVDGDGVFLETSTKRKESLFMPPERFLGKRIADLGLDAAIVDGFLMQLRAALADSRTTLFEYELPSPAGMLSFEARIVPIAVDKALLVIRDETERKKRDDLLRAALAEKEILLKEIHHRVKNNMQIISSLIQLQSYSVRDEVDREMLHETQSRIGAMASIHELLYQSKDLSSVDLSDYLGSVVRELAYSFQSTSIRFEAEPLKLGLDEAMPLGLIANELLLNSMKYAYPAGEPGLVVLSLARIGDTISLKVADEGRGLPEGVDPALTDTMGFTLIRSLAAQIRAKLAFGGPPGFSAEVRFPSPASSVR